MNYLRCPYDIQEKISLYAQEKWFNEWYVACIDYYHNYSYNIWNHGALRFAFLINTELVVLVSQQIQFLWMTPS